MRLSSVIVCVVCVGMAGCGTIGRVGRGVSESVAQAGISVGDRLSRKEEDKLAALPDIAAPVKIELLWEAKIGDGLQEGYPKLRPAWSPELLVVASASREGLRAYRLADRSEAWHTELPEPAVGGIGYGNGLFLVGTREGRVVALSPDDGGVLWTGQVSSEVLTAPAAAGNTVVVASGDGRLTALSAVDGTRKWSISRDVPPLSLRGGASPLIAGGLVVQGFASGRLVAAALNNGLEAWDTPLSNPRGRSELERMVDVSTAPLERNGVVYAAAYQGHLAAVGLQSGEQIWSRELSSHAPLAADEFNVYATDADGRVVAFDQRSGLTYWEQDALKGRGLTGPAVAGRHVAVADVYGYVHLLSADSGKPVARVRPTKDGFVFPAEVRDGVFHFLSSGGRLYALEPAD